MAQGKIRTFTSKGGALPFRQRPVFPNNGGVPQIVRARLTRNPIKGASVRVVNPRGLAVNRIKRHGGLGMGTAQGLATE